MGAFEREYDHYGHIAHERQLVTFALEGEQDPRLWVVLRKDGVLLIERADGIVYEMTSEGPAMVTWKPKPLPKKGARRSR